MDENTEKVAQTVPPSDYVDKTYKVMQVAYGKDFTLDDKTYRSKIQSDPNYVNKVYQVMQHQYGSQFTLDTKTFNNKIGYKTTEQQTPIKQNIIPPSFTQLAIQDKEKPIPFDNKHEVAQTQMKIAQALYNKGDKNGAVQILDKVKEDNKDVPEYANYADRIKALKLQSEGDYAGAAATYGAMDSKHKSIDDLYAQAWNKKQSGDIGGAVKDATTLKNSLDENKYENIETLINTNKLLGQIYSQVGNKEGVEKQASVVKHLETQKTALETTTDQAEIDMLKQPEKIMVEFLRAIPGFSSTLVNSTESVLKRGEEIKQGKNVAKNTVGIIGDLMSTVFAGMMQTPENVSIFDGLPLLSNSIEASIKNNPQLLANHQGLADKVQEWAFSAPSKISQSIGWTKEGDDSFLSNSLKFGDALWGMVLLGIGSNAYEKLFTEGKTPSKEEIKNVTEQARTDNPEISNIIDKSKTGQPLSNEETEVVLNAADEGLNSAEKLKETTSPIVKEKPEEPKVEKTEGETEETKPKAETTKEEKPEINELTGKPKPELPENVKLTPTIITDSGKEYYGADHGKAMDEARKDGETIGGKEIPEDSKSKEYKDMRSENGKFTDQEGVVRSREENAKEYNSINQSEDIPSKNLAEEYKPKEEEIPLDKNSLIKTSNVGTAYRIQEDRVATENMSAPKKLQGVTLDESRQTGRDLLNTENNPEEFAQSIADDFLKESDPNKRKVSQSEFSVAAEWYAILIKEKNKAIDNGDTEAAKITGEKADKWLNDVVNPMKNVFGRLGITIQGDVDVDTGTVTGLRNEYKKRTGKDFTPDQEKTAKIIVDQLNDVNQQIENKTPKFDEVFQKIIAEQEKQIKELEEKNKEYEQKIKNNLETSTKKYIKSSKFTDWVKSAEGGIDKLIEQTRQDIFKTSYGQASANALPVQLGQMAKLASLYVAKGGLKATEAISMVYDEFKDKFDGLNHKDIRDAFEKELIANEKEPKKSPHQIATEKAISSTERSIKNLEDKLKGISKEKSPSLVDETNEKLKNLREEKERLKENLKQKIANEKEQSETDDLRVKFEGRKGNDFTPQERLSVWKYAKENYIHKLDSNLESFDKAITGIATDLNLTPEQVRNIFAKEKTFKPLTEELYILRNKRKYAEQVAKLWVREADKSRASKIIQNIPSAAFQMRVFGHSSVGMITHAGMTFFDNPVQWFKNWVKSYKYAYGKIADYEAEIADLKNDVNYNIAKKAGLKNDVTKTTDEYVESSKSLQKITKYVFGNSKSEAQLAKDNTLAKMLTAGDRGFDILKRARQDTFNKYYNQLSADEKADPNTLKKIAEIANNSTGAANLDLGRGAFNTIVSTVFFAPRLEVSRWKKLIINTPKVISTYSKMALGKEVPISDKVEARILSKRMAKQAGMYVGGLLVNQAILSAMGSKNNINFTNPSKNDFLKFKFGDKNLDMTGGMLSTFRFVSDIISLPFKDNKTDTKRNLFLKHGGDYLTGKLSPFADLLLESVLTQEDYSGRPLPFSSKKGSAKRPKYGWGEYISENYTPIPIAETARNIYDEIRKQGVDESMAKKLTVGAIVFAVSAGTGAKLTETTQQKSDAEAKVETKVENIKKEESKTEKQKESEKKAKSEKELNTRKQELDVLNKKSSLSHEEKVLKGKLEKEIESAKKVHKKSRKHEELISEENMIKSDFDENKLYA